MSLCRRHPLLACLAPLAAAMLAGGLPLRGSSQSASVELLPVPGPDLAVLEPAVAEQLGRAQELLAAVRRREGVSASELADSFGALGTLYHAYGLADAAEACYQNAGRLAPADFRWSYYLGYLYQNAGRLDEATRLYARALEAEPRNVPALVRLGETLLSLDRLEEAEDALGRALEADSSSAPALAALGQIALSRGRYEEAVGHLTAALSTVSEANRLHYPLALAYRALGDEEQARRHLALVGPVGVRPDDPWVDELEGLITGERVHLLRGGLAYRAGRFAEAAAEFGRAVAAAPASARARINLGSALAALGDSGAAIAQLRHALELDPDNPTAHLNLGRLLSGEGATAEAVEHLEAAVDLLPTDPEPRLELAAQQAGAGRIDEALAQFRKVVEIDPLDEEARLGEAELLVRLGRFAEARRRLESAHELMPEQGRTAHGLARLLAACPDRGQRDGPRALDLALRVYQARPTAGHAETVAAALAEMDRCEEAAAWQRRALDAAGAGSDAAAAERLRADLERYEGQRPCRPPEGR